jgi:hypothetical protein
MGEYGTRLETILREAGRRLAEGCTEKDKSCRKKGAIDLVTRWDTAIESFLKEALAAAFPGHGFLGEEYGASGGTQERIFVIDPIDGTTNFVHGFPFCCVSVACVSGNSRLAGGVYAPLLGELYLAERGEGAFCNGRPLAVSAERRLEDSLFVTGFSYERRTQREGLLQLVGNAIAATRGGGGPVPRPLTSVMSHAACLTAISRQASRPGTLPPAPCWWKRPAAGFRFFPGRRWISTPARSSPATGICMKRPGPFFWRESDAMQKMQYGVFLSRPA